MSHRATVVHEGGGVEHGDLALVVDGTAQVAFVVLRIGTTNTHRKLVISTHINLARK